MGYVIYLLGLAVCALGAHGLPITEYMVVMVGTIIIYTGGLLND